MKTYTLALTEREVWYLYNSYQAAFTDPDSMNEHESAVNQKLEKLMLKARRPKE